jgi:GNAT superfamily N-acetyltransferase
MYWRDRSLGHGEPKKRAMAKLVRDGREPGLLAYDGEGSPVGWVAVGPREEYTAILRSPQYRPRAEGGGDRVWAIVCFTIDKQARRQGIATALLEAATAYAFEHGATSVEAYPHVADPRDYMGHVQLYRDAGFEQVRDANKRAIVRLER